uniref:Nitric oxide synthase-interacting protein zinc-finger domain-containing protein n=1 Tax=Babesia bovis TaxID=5865 RepID=S6BI06_BABBO|nr:conserved hypothetical protein [Babesia bovis]
MTRHSKNNTANPIFTYHERKNVKDFNTQRQRLGADSMRRCEQCCLCLSTAEKPVSTSHGYVYCKECILKCFEKQMDEYKRDHERYVKLQQMDHMRKAEKLEELQESKKRQLIDTGVYGISGIKKTKGEGKESSVKDSSFWVAGVSTTSKGDETSTSLPEPPKKILRCPITGKPLKIKELVDIHPDLSENTDNGDPIWICSVSQRPIGHKEVMLNRSTGRLVLRRYIEVCNDTDTKYIKLIPGGTAFSAHNNVIAKKYREALL